MKVDYPTASEEYRYDKAGNRMEKWVNGSMAEQYAYDAANRMVSRSLLTANSDGTLTTRESHEYAYDPQGNMLSDGKRSFTYDAANRLSHVTTQDGNTQVNRYDGEGLRAEMEENGRLVQFLFDGDKVVAETDCEGTNIRYIRGYELISSDCEKARTYYHYASDELGSITHITDEAGNVCNHYEYDAFGDFIVREETVDNRFGFTGEQYDPVAGLYYLRARFYNPVIGRFIQEDTYYGDGLNLYAYCGNNPVRYVDPSGFAKLPCPEKEAAVNKLKAVGLSDEQCELLFTELRKDYDVKGALNKINKTLEEMESKHGKGIFDGTDVRLGTKTISQAEYKKLRNKTPSKLIQDMVNERIAELLGTDDFALPGLIIDGRLQADHIVSMKKIVKMDGFEELSYKQKLAILNLEVNFKGLSESANKSKGAMTYWEWELYKKLNIKVDSSFRNSMIIQEKILERYIQAQIDILGGK